MAMSKNKRRKQERAEYHAILKEFERDPSSAEALRFLADLKEEYFRQVDGELSGLVSEVAEKSFVDAIVKSIDHGDGWVIIYRADGDTVKLRSNIWEYIRSRRTRDPYCSHAAESLASGAVMSIQPRSRQVSRRR